MLPRLGKGRILYLVKKIGLDVQVLRQVLYRQDMARVTGLEPATSGLTGQRSNQLSYTPAWGDATQT